MSFKQNYKIVVSHFLAKQRKWEENMAYNNPYSAYTQTGVKTATQGKLVVMLYNEAVKQLNSAINWFNSEGKVDPCHIEKLNSNILKAQEIITELMVSLDMSSGEEIAQNLLSLYVFFNKELMNANMTLNKEKIKSVCQMMSDLRDSWVQAESTTTTSVSSFSPAISITG